MRRKFHPLSFLGAGLTGSVVFLVVELVLLPVTKHVRADWILRLIASLMAGPVTLSAQTALVPGIVVVGLGMHVALSLLFGLAFCIVEDTLPFWGAVAASIAMGIVLYLFDFHVMTAWFPWFVTARGIATLLAHVLFGVTTALTHKRLRTALPARASREVLA